MLPWLLVTAWEPIATEPLLIERRPQTVAGRELFEIRVTATSKVTPEQFGETLWKHHEYVQFVPHLRQLDVLATQGDAKRVYQRITMPVVKDRDYVLRIVRSFDGSVYESKFETITDGPPPNEDCVRISTIKGSWTISPGEKGGSDVVYQVLSDPGPSIPTWILNIAQKDAIGDLVKAMVKRAEKTHPR